MNSITDDIFSQLSGPALQQISQQLGTGHTQTAGAVAAALPLLLGALGRNASQPQGAEALFGACAGMLFAFGTGTAATVVAVPLLVAGIDLAAVLAGGDGIGRGDSGVLSLTLPGGPDVPALGLLDAVFLAAFAAWAMDSASCAAV